jgi:pimeloyl-ACP methyl ester carboxylesterase
MSTALTHAVEAKTVEVNDTTIYCEVRGSGQPVLFISGATGDAGHFAQVADILADEFKVVTYDRCANSRSPRPEGWTATSMREQAAHAAGLLDALELAPASVFGTSAGALIALWLVLEHPDSVTKAIVHEPPCVNVVPSGAEFMGAVHPQVEAAMASGGPRAAVEAFLRFVAGDAAFEALEPELRERMLENGETLFAVEFPAYLEGVPDEAALAGVRTPVHILCGSESAPLFAESSVWLAERLGVDAATVGGAHVSYLVSPKELAERIRPLLRQAA